MEILLLCMVYTAILSRGVKHISESLLALTEVNKNIYFNTHQSLVGIGV